MRHRSKEGALSTHFGVAALILDGGLEVAFHFADRGLDELARQALGGDALQQYL